VDPADYARHDGLSLAELIARREVSAEDVAAAALAAHTITHPRLRAVVEVYDDALDPGSPGSPPPPFAGVPFLIKDVGPDFAGRRLEHGSRLCQGFVGDQNTAYGRLIMQAGFNLIGRTNTPEFSMALSAQNKLYGATENPWAQGFSTAGSSGGAAAAVAAGVVPIAHASDIGGSTRGPAAWCGTVGLHPSRGRVSSGPLEAETGFGMQQSFVLTRTVRDTAAMLDRLGVPQPGDPFVIRRAERPYLEYVSVPGPRLRVGWSTKPLMDAPVDPEVATAVERTALVLEGLGHHVDQAAPDVDLAAIDRACLDAWYYGFDRWLDDFAAATGRQVGPDTVERGTLRFYEFARSRSPQRMLDALDELNTIRRAIGPFFCDHDVWVSPTCAQVAQPQGEFSMDVDLPPEEFLHREQRPCQYLVPYNATGQPAISLPLAQHSNGLPIGVQIGARPGEEHLLIALAAELERALPWADRTPAQHVSRLCQRTQAVADDV
jgi:amidase